MKGARNENEKIIVGPEDSHVANFSSKSQLRRLCLLSFNSFVQKRSIYISSLVLSSFREECFCIHFYKVLYKFAEILFDKKFLSLNKCNFIQIYFKFYKCFPHLSDSSGAFPIEYYMEISSSFGYKSISVCMCAVVRC